jgi:hypothetical protein
MHKFGLFKPPAIPQTPQTPSDFLDPPTRSSTRDLDKADTQETNTWIRKHKQRRPYDINGSIYKGKKYMFSKIKHVIVSIDEDPNYIIKTYYIAPQDIPHVDEEDEEYIKDNASTALMDRHKLTDFVKREITFQRKTYFTFNSSIIDGIPIFVPDVTGVYIDDKCAFVQICMENYTLLDAEVSKEIVARIDDEFKQKGIWHNDLNQGNIRYTYNGIVLLDFGSADYTLAHKQGGRTKKRVR